MKVQTMLRVIYCKINVFIPNCVLPAIPSHVIIFYTMDFGDEADFDILGDAFGDAIMEALNGIDTLTEEELDEITKEMIEKGELVPIDLHPTLPPLPAVSDLPTIPVLSDDLKSEKVITEPSSPLRIEEKDLEIKKDLTLHFQIIHLKDSYYINIGLKGTNASFDTLVTAIQTKFDPMPSSTSILPSSSINDEIAHRLSKLLSKRTQKVIYLSYNIPVDSLNPEEDLILQKTLNELLAKA